MVEGERKREWACTIDDVDGCPASFQREIREISLGMLWGEIS